MSYDLGQFAQDNEKALSRQFELEKLMQTFPDPEDRANLKAMFYSGPSLVEFDQALEPAGVKGRNTWAIDTYVDAYESALKDKHSRPTESQASQVNVKNCSDKELYRSQHGFGFISLDHLANYGPGVIESIDNVMGFDPPVLDNKSLLLINTQAARESPKYSRRLATFYFMAQLIDMAEQFYGFQLKNRIYGKDARDLRRKIQGIASGSSAFEELGSHITEMYALFKSMGSRPTHPLRRTRGGIYSEVQLKAKYPLLGMLDIKDVYNAVKLLPAELREHHLKNVKAGEAELGKVKDLVVKKDGSTFQDTINLAAFAKHGLEELYLTLGMHSLGLVSYQGRGQERKALASMGEINEDLIDQIMFMGYSTNALFSSQIKDYDTFSYISKSGRPMLMHAFSLDKGFLDIKNLYLKGSMKGSPLQRVLESREPKYESFRKALADSGGLLTVFAPLQLAKNKRVRSFRAWQELMGYFTSKKWVRQASLFHASLSEKIALEYDKHETLTGRLERIQEGLNWAMDSILELSRPANGTLTTDELKKAEVQSILDLQDCGLTPTEIHGQLYKNDPNVTPETIEVICGSDQPTTLYDKPIGPVQQTLDSTVTRLLTGEEKTFIRDMLAEGETYDAIHEAFKEYGVKKSQVEDVKIRDLTPAEIKEIRKAKTQYPGEPPSLTSQDIYEIGFKGEDISVKHIEAVRRYLTDNEKDVIVGLYQDGFNAEEIHELHFDGDPDLSKPQIAAVWSRFQHQGENWRKENRKK